jgi:hypothetical protein
MCLLEEDKQDQASPSSNYESDWEYCNGSEIEFSEAPVFKICSAERRELGVSCFILIPNRFDLLPSPMKHIGAKNSV